MTSSALKPPRPHGYLRYKEDGCRCFPCRRAMSQYRSAKRAAVEAGTWKPYADATPIRAHLAVLREAGIGYKRAARLAGVSETSVLRLLVGGPHGKPRREQIRTVTADALLALRPDPARQAPGLCVPVLGTLRRIQALCAMGWSLTAQADRIGWTVANYQAIFRREQLQKKTTDTISDLYEKLSGTPAPPGYGATLARKNAGRRGWFPPLAWDDDTIDVPDAFPAVLPPTGVTVPGADELAIQHAAAGHIDPATLTGPTRAAYALRLRDSGMKFDEIGRQLRVTGQTVNSVCRRYATRGAEACA